MVERTSGAPFPASRLLRGVGSAFRDGPAGGIAVVFAAVVIVGLVWAGSTFLSGGNLAAVGSDAIIPLILGTGGAVALLAGVVDLSVGANAGLSAAVFASIMVHHWAGPVAALVVLGVGAAIGGANAFVIVTCGADPIIATIGTLTALTGLETVLNGNNGTLSFLSPSLYHFTNEEVGPVPLLLILSLAFVLVMAYAMGFTRVGRHVRAVGGDPRAAERAGIRIVRVRYGALIVSGICGALAGIVYVGQLGGTSATLGSDAVFITYAGLIIGGYSLVRGGQGSPIGGAVGLLVVAGVTDIVALKAINTYFTDLVVACVILFAVTLDRLRGGDAYE